jgi:myosin heavy subunit
LFLKGKTRTITYIIDYFTQVIDKSHKNSTNNLLAHTNNILEAFGNARTLKNDNSSRFCKLIDLRFCTLTSVYETNLTAFLLEKTRIKQNLNDNERSFHIFYQLICGTSDAEKATLGLNDNIMNEFKQTVAESIDAQNWTSLQDSFQKLGLLDDTHDINKLLSAILHLNLCHFKENATNEQIILDKTKYDSVNYISKLLGCERNDFENCMTIQELSIKNTKVTRFCSLSEVRNRKNSMAMLIYSQIFDYLVDKLNENLNRTNQRALNTSRPCRIAKVALLDVFGFENLDNGANSVEQLCINYANERLQQVYIEYFFKLTRETYRTENIIWTYDKSTDNMDLINLVELKFMPALNEECLLKRQVNLKDLSKRISDIFEANNSAKSYKAKWSHQTVSHPHSFTIKHYAEHVTYSCENMIEKNKDHIPMDLLSFLATTSNQFLNKILDKFLCKKLRSNKFIGVLNKFKTNLDTLLDSLKFGKVIFIRCMKPNEQFDALAFDRCFVRKQLQSSGIVDLVQLHSDIFTHFTSYKKFVILYLPILLLSQNLRAKYGMFHSAYQTANKVDLEPENNLLISKLKGYVELIIEECSIVMPIERSTYGFGLSKFFYKNECAKIFNGHLKLSTMKAAQRIQTAWRAYWASKEVLNISHRTQMHHMDFDGKKSDEKKSPLDIQQKSKSTCTHVNVDFKIIYSSKNSILSKRDCEFKISLENCIT